MAKDSIADVWETRFHRGSPNVERVTKEWIFYISRPGLELLRKTNDAGIQAYGQLRTTVQQFLETNGNALDYNGPFTIQTTPSFSSNKTSVYSTLVYPFDVQDEVQGKRGVVIHLGEGDAKDFKSTPEFQRDGIPSMFDQKFRSDFDQYCIAQSETNRPLPPGADRADPMWAEFPSSKVLPTDQLLDERCSQGRFRTIVSHQFIEIRLISSLGQDRKSSREQVDALLRFTSFESGYTHFAGAPGTGKSTLLHMIVAHQIFKNFLAKRAQKDPQRIFYYIPSSYLKDEARREIRTILDEVYAPAIQQQVSNLEILMEGFQKEVEFVAQEDLFLTNTPRRKYNITHDNVEAMRASLNIKLTDEKTNQRLQQTRRGLRQVVFGVFGDHLNFQQWVQGLRGKSIQDGWMKKKISLARPSQRESVMHDINLGTFHPADDAKQLAADVAKLPLYDAKGQDQFWDATALVHQSSKLPNHPKKSVWSRLKGKVDVMVIDEIQDISITEIRVLLDHFSNRSTENDYADFRMVGAGDENQNVKGLVYMPNNSHFRFLFADWAQELRQQGKTRDGMQLSHELRNYQDETLSSSYRVFDEMVPYAAQILGHLRALHEANTAQRKVAPAKMEVTQFGRKGMFLTCLTNVKNKDEKNINLWGSAIAEYLESQLDPSEKNPVIRVAFIYDEGDVKNGPSVNEHPLSDRLSELNHTLGSRLNEIVQSFTINLIEKWKSDPPQTKSNEWRRELALRGVMSVKDIKGLTVPIAIVLPPRRALSEQGLNNADALSKFLVQITRAQYCNLLLQETRIIEGRKAIDTGLTVDKTEWLNTIIEHSVGLNQTFTNLFEATMRESESAILWDRLSDRAKAIGEALHGYVLWLKAFHEQLANEDNSLPEKWGRDYIKQLTTSSIEPSIVLETKREWKISEIRKLEDEHFLGERLTPQILNSLHLFVLCNSLIRRRVKKGNTVPTKYLESGMRSWLSTIKGLPTGELDYDTTLARDWFEVVLGEHEGKEESIVQQAIESTFKVKEQWIWPNLSLPRLNMGAWRLSGNPQELGDEELEAAWMVENSSFYNMTTQPLTNVAEIIHGQSNPKSIRLKLFLAMTALDPILFSEAIQDALSLDDEHERGVLLDWFVEVFARDQDRTVFKADVRKHLENSIKGGRDNSINQNLRTHLERIDSIPALEKLLTAFEFHSWHQCVRLQGLLERCIDLTYVLIEPQLLHQKYDAERTELKQNLNGNREKLSRAERLIEKLNDDRTSLMLDSVTRESFLELKTLDDDEIEKALRDVDYGSASWLVLNNENRIRVHQKNEVEFNTRRGELERKLSELDTDIERHTTTHGKKMQLNNPFRLNSRIHLLFKAYFDGLPQDEEVEHRMWFNLLYGFEGLLNGDLSLSQLTELNIRFPSMGTPLMKKLHVCVDAFVDDDLGLHLDRWIEQIEKNLSPRRKEAPWIAPLMNLLESTKVRYREVEKELAESGSMFEHRHVNGKVSTLERRFYRSFMKKCKDLPRLFLGMIFNTESNQTVRLSPLALERHVNSQKGRLIHAIITAEFEVKPSEVTEQWSTLVWKGRDDFVSNFAQKGDSTHLMLLPHEHWTSSGTAEPSFPAQYCSGATLRAVAHLCMKNLDEAERCFKEGGLMNHHAALKLYRTTSLESDWREDLIVAMCEIMDSEVELYERAMASADTEAHKNKRYRMNFGPSLRDPCLRFDDNQNLDHLKVRDVNDSPNNWFIQFWKAATLVNHSREDRGHLNAMLNRIRNPDLYQKHLEEWWTETSASRTMFADDRLDERGARLNPTTRFEWKWNKDGYEPCHPQPDFHRKNIVHDFLSKSMKRNPVPTSDEMTLHISKLTNVDGPTLVLLMPNRAHLEMEVLEEESEHKRTVRSQLETLEEFLRETKALVEYAKQRGARRAFMSMLNDLNDPRACMEHLAYSVGVRNNHYQHLLDMLIRLASLEKTELPRDLVVEDLNISEAMAEQHGLVLTEES